jgi:hypothetical protein
VGKDFEGDLIVAGHVQANCFGAELKPVDCPLLGALYRQDQVVRVLCLDLRCFTWSDFYRYAGSFPKFA